jgi:hypothetical protein
MVLVVPQDFIRRSECPVRSVGEAVTVIEAIQVFSTTSTDLRV